MGPENLFHKPFLVLLEVQTLSAFRQVMMATPSRWPVDSLKPFAIYQWLSFSLSEGEATSPEELGATRSRGPAVWLWAGSFSSLVPHLTVPTSTDVLGLKEAIHLRYSPGSSRTSAQ